MTPSTRALLTELSENVETYEDNDDLISAAIQSINVDASELENIGKGNVEKTKGIGIFVLCLSFASFIYFIYTCVLKNYYYGYSFGIMITTKEVQCSLILLLTAVILSGFIWWKNGCSSA